MKSCNKHIIETLKMSDEMIHLSNKGDDDREDTSCGILYGILRDAAYKIKKVAEDEKRRHILKGLWDEDRQV